MSESEEVEKAQQAHRVAELEALRAYGQMKVEETALNVNSWFAARDRLNEKKDALIAAVRAEGQREIPDKVWREIQGAHFINIRIRINGEWREYEADWIRRTPQQRAHVANCRCHQYGIDEGVLGNELNDGCCRRAMTKTTRLGVQRVPHPHPHTDPRCLPGKEKSE